MNVVVGAVTIAVGVFLIVYRHSEAESWIRSRNRTFSLLRMKRRYGEKEVRQSIRVALLVGVWAIGLGVYFIVADVQF